MKFRSAAVDPAKSLHGAADQLVCDWIATADDANARRELVARAGTLLKEHPKSDELASAAGMDPLAFRLRLLNDPRAVEVLKRTAEMIGWQTRPSPNPTASRGNLLVGRGISYVHYKQAENHVAIAMEVAVDGTAQEADTFQLPQSISPVVESVRHCG